MHKTVLATSEIVITANEILRTSRGSRTPFNSCFVLADGAFFSFSISFRLTFSGVCFQFFCNQERVLDGCAAHAAGREASSAALVFEPSLTARASAYSKARFLPLSPK